MGLHQGYDQGQIYGFDQGLDIYIFIYINNPNKQ